MRAAERVPDGLAPWFSGGLSWAKKKRLEFGMPR